MTLARVIAGEALAYVRSGWYAAHRSSRRPAPSQADLGVLFVHGLGASSTQFRALERSLGSAADHLDVFEYGSFDRFDRVLAGLALHVARSPARRLIVIGHSLGGLLLRMLLQSPEPPPGVAGFVSICAPLSGTTRAKLAAWHGDLRSISPESRLIRDLEQGRTRLDRWSGSILTIGSTRDHFVTPSESAFLDGHAVLRLDDCGHVGSLFDPRVHHAVRELIARHRTV
jgi:triacylglycerol lipase